MRTLHVRVDASPDIGLGHLKRSVAIAEIAIDLGYRVRWYCNAWVDEVGAMDGVPGVLHDGDAHWLDNVTSGDLVWVDGYSIPDAETEDAMDRGARVGRIDDHGEGRFSAHVLVDPDSTVTSMRGSRPGTVILAGPQYALVRREFRRFGGSRRATDPVLVCFGGTDVGGLTPSSCTALSRAEIPTRCILGAEASAEGCTADEIFIHPAPIADLMSRSSVLLTAAGNIVMEAACMNLPFVYTVVAPNQRRLAATLETAGVGRRIDADASGTAIVAAVSELRSGQRHAGAVERLDLFDGLGAARVWRVLTRSLS